jgi:hypothetical protein
LSNTSTKGALKEIPTVDIEKQSEVSPNEEIKGKLTSGEGKMLKFESS